MQLQIRKETVVMESEERKDRGRWNKKSRERRRGEKRGWNEGRPEREELQTILTLLTLEEMEKPGESGGSYHIGCVA